MRPLLTSILAAAALPALCACDRAADAATNVSAAVSERPGVRRDRLAEAVDRLFSDETLGETRAVVVFHKGAIVAERYAPPYDAKTRFIGWSMSKTVTAALIGLLIADGRLRLDAPAPVPAWQQAGDPRGEITLRQLLQMRSGLRHSEADNPPYRSSEVRMLFLDGRDDMAGFAEEQPLADEPGRVFRYSTNTSVILSDIAARALTAQPKPAIRQRAMASYLHGRLFDPAGLTSMHEEYDAAGTLTGGSMIHANARDWGRFGELLRNGGASGGAQILPRGWVQFMLTPSPRDGAYGGHVWLNRKRPKGREDVLFVDQGPPGIFGLVGHLGQYVIVSPRQKLTIVRLGYSSPEERVGVRAALARIVKLYPEG